MEGTEAEACFQTPGSELHPRLLPVQQAVPQTKAG